MRSKLGKGDGRTNCREQSRRLPTCNRRRDVWDCSSPTFFRRNSRVLEHLSIERSRMGIAHAQDSIDHQRRHTRRKGNATCSTRPRTLIPYRHNLPTTTANWSIPLHHRGIVADRFLIQPERPERLFMPTDGADDLLGCAHALTFFLATFFALNAGHFFADAFSKHDRVLTQSGTGSRQSPILPLAPEQNPMAIHRSQSPHVLVSLMTSPHACLPVIR